MESKKLKGGLEALERSDEPLHILVTRACHLLDLVHDDTDDQSKETTTNVARRNAYTFKEQRALRWLIRRLTEDLGQHHRSEQNGQTLRFAWHLRPWLLLLDLMTIIPTDNLNDILLERKFTSMLNAYLALHLDITPIASSAEEEGTDSQRQPKRRKTSPPEPGVGSTRLGETLLQICIRCANLTTTNPESGYRPSLWASVDDCAATLSASLKLTSRLLQLDTSNKADVLKSLALLPQTWLGRPTALSDQAKHHEIAQFNGTCLPSVLSTLELLEKHPNDKSKEHRVAVNAIQKLVATNTVLRLRERFIKKHLKSWRNYRPCLNWSVIQPVYRDFSSWLSIPQTSQAPHWHPGIHHLHKVAVNLVPRYDVRRKQQEQEWLDALLLVLAYMTCPHLSQLEVDNLGNPIIIDAVYDTKLIDHPQALTALARSAGKLHYSPSLHALSYLTAAVTSWPALENIWELISRLLSADSNVLHPKIGVSTSDFALKHIVTRIEQTEVGTMELQTLLTDIMIPVLRNLAQSRALEDFVLLWEANLEESLRAWRPAATNDTMVAAVHVWQQDELFQQFTLQVSLLTAPSFVNSLLQTTKTALETLQERAGTTLDVFAKLAILSAAMSAPGRSSSDTETLLLEQCVTLVLKALTKQSDYQGQRWRLWKFLACAQGSPAADGLVDAVEDDGIHRNGAALAQLLEDKSATRTAQWYQECLERFRVLANTSSKTEGASVPQFDAELTALKELTGKDSTSPPKEGWSGLSLTIQCNYHLVTACIAILVARPDLLRAKSDFFKAMLDNTLTDSSFNGKSNGSGVHLQELLLSSISETGPRERSDLARRFTHHPASENHGDAGPPRLFEGLSQELSRGALKAIGEDLFQHLNTGQDDSDSLKDVASRLITMNLVASRCAVSYTKSDAWSSWLSIIDILPSRVFWDDASCAFVMFRCIGDILSQVWTRSAEQDDIEHRKTHAMLEVITQRLAGLKPSKSKVRLSKDLVVTHFARILTYHGTIFPGSAAKLETMRSELRNLIISDLAVLSKGEPATSSLVIAAVLLELLHDLQDVTAIGPHARQKLQTVASDLVDSLAAYETDAESSGLLSLARHLIEGVMSSVNASSSQLDLTGTLSRLEKDVGKEGFNSAQHLDLTALLADSFVRGLSQDSYVHLLDLLEEKDDSDHTQLLKPFMAASILNSVSDKDITSDPRLKQHFLNLASLKSTSSSTSLDQIFFALETARMLLETHSSVPTQSTIDTLLSQLSLLLSSTSPLEPSPTLPPSAIYTRVTALLGVLLTRFRRRLSDRHHLLLGLLQSLLRPLFYTPALQARARRPAATGSDPSSFLRQLPRWLIRSPQPDHLPLPASSATQLTRLLTSIANPTVSAAKSASRAPPPSRTNSNPNPTSDPSPNNLNDATKAVRIRAAQHLQYLITEYCRCVLDAELQPRTKEKLMPGIFAILDAMGRDLMRAMNAAMDPSSRAIFRGVYEEWSRDGKWDQR
jgi:nucleolar pre-ribosomal-associated protein 2